MDYKNFIEYEKQYSFLSKYAKKFKSRLMPNYLVTNRPTNFFIKSSPNLNASVFVGDTFGDVVYLTQEDFKKLSKNDLKALLSHEIGHIYYGVNSHLFISMLEVIGSFCIFVCILLFGFIFYSLLYLLIIAFGSILTANNTISTSLLGQIHPTLYYILMSVTFLFILLFIAFGIRSFAGRRNEEFADRIGAILVGKKKYLHMLRFFRNYETSELNKDEVMARKLRFSPKAYLHCLIVLFFQHIKYHLNIIHPTWKKRIRAIKKLKFNNPDVK